MAKKRGRKPKNTKRLTTSVRLDAALHRWVCSHDNTADFIRQLIYDAYVYSAESEEAVTKRMARTQATRQVKKTITSSPAYILLYVDPETQQIRCNACLDGLTKLEDPRTRFFQSVEHNAKNTITQVNKTFTEWATKPLPNEEHPPTDELNDAQPEDQDQNEFVPVSELEDAIQ